MRTLAIGDIHGCAVTFRKMLTQLELSTGDRLALLGDMIDRGPDSKGVFDEVLRLREKGIEVVLLRGNHEELMMMSELDEMNYLRWLSAGGRQCLESFGVHSAGQLDDVYLGLLAETKEYYEADGFIFVHAGLNFEPDNPFEAVRDMRWIRYWEEEVNYEWLGNRKVLYGHTPVSKTDIEQQHRHFSERKVLDLDAGCVYVSREGLGHLAAYDCTEDRLFFQKYAG